MLKSWKYIPLAILIVLIILFAGGYQLPKYATRLTALAVLAVIDMLYWIPVCRQLGFKYRKIASFTYWIPQALLTLFFLAGMLVRYQNWTPFLRIYYPGILLIALIGKGIFLMFMLLGDMAMIIPNAIRVMRMKSSLRKRFRRLPVFMNTGIFVSLFVMILYVAGMFFWVNNYKVNRVELTFKELPAEFDGYKIVQLSDMHLGSILTKRPIKKIVTLVNEQHPDLILFTGDLVNFTTNEALPFEHILSQFKAPDGVFCILGNHDYGEYAQWNSKNEKALNDSALFSLYRRIGWNLLRNQNSLIHRDASTIAIVGVENWSVTKRFGKKGDLKKALQCAEDADFHILMSHDPTHWDAEVNKLFSSIELTLSGHTHAFQLAVESGNLKWSPAQWLFKEWAGLYSDSKASGEKQYLYVSRGTGTLGYPGRIFTRPEITLFILRRDKN